MTYLHPAERLVLVDVDVAAVTLALLAVVTRIARARAALVRASVVTVRAVYFLTRNTAFTATLYTAYCVECIGVMFEHRVA